MTERLPDQKTIEQQEQQRAERNRAAVQRGLQHARHEDHRETPEGGRKKSPDTGPQSN